MKELTASENRKRLNLLRAKEATKENRGRRAGSFMKKAGQGKGSDER